MAYLGQQELKTVRIETVVTSNGAANYYPRGGYAKGFIDVYVDGFKKVLGTDFNAPDGISIEFTANVTPTATVQMVAYGPLTSTSVVSRAGDSMEGNLTVPNLIVSSNAESNVLSTQILNVANQATLSYGANITGTLVQSGDVSITGNLTLAGSLVITGNATSVSTSSLSVDDTIIKLGANNETDSLDIGFTGLYSNGSANLYSGIVRNATDKKYYFFKDYDQLPGNDIDVSDPSFAVANVVGNFEGNVVSNNVLTDILNAGSINLTASLHLTGDAAGIKQDSTSIYGGDAGTGEGRIEYHDNSWVFNSGSDSTDIAVLQRGNLVKATIDNDGVYQGTANNALYLGGVAAAAYTNATNLSTGTLNNSRLANSGVTANTYGNTTHFAVVTVNDKGIVTNASAGAIALGPQGYQGYQGVQGTNGTIGVDGNQGFQGHQGNQGNQGYQGSQGTNGTIGVDGNQGFQGYQGNQGNQGYQGVQGHQGNQGNQGNQGYQGVQGATGTGNQGNQGYQGYQGVQGATGTGAQGNQGYQGATGTGAQGAQGAAGAQGATGSFSTYTTGNFTMNNGSPTIYFQDTDHRSSMIHCNSNLWYVLRGDGTNSTNWATYNGNWPLVINLENNDITAGGNFTAVLNVTAYSDRKLKKNIVTVDSALEKVLRLRGVYYERIDDPEQRRKLGVIAQEVQEVLPEVVIESKINDESDVTLTVDYGNIVGLLIEAIKEQQAQIDELKATR